MKTSFKVGSLDQLMELMDVFQKYDVSIDGQCKRNERMLVPVAFNITLTHITQESHNSSAHIASAL